VKATENPIVKNGGGKPYINCRIKEYLQDGRRKYKKQQTTLYDNYKHVFVIKIFKDKI